MDITSTVSVAIGVAGLAYAIYQGRQYRKLRTVNRIQAWFIYSKANNVTALIQNAVIRYQLVHRANLDAMMIEFLSKGDAHSLELIKETIRQVQLAEPRFDESAFQRWISQGKLNEKQKALFVQMAINDADSKERK